jgi:hypothetical protein
MKKMKGGARVDKSTNLLIEEIGAIQINLIDYAYQTDKPKIEVCREGVREGEGERVRGWEGERVRGWEGDEIVKDSKQRIHTTHNNNK